MGYHGLSFWATWLSRPILSLGTEIKEGLRLPALEMPRLESVGQAEEDGIFPVRAHPPVEDLDLIQGNELLSDFLEGQVAQKDKPLSLYPKVARN